MRPFLFLLASLPFSFLFSQCPLISEQVSNATPHELVMAERGVAMSAPVVSNSWISSIQLFSCPNSSPQYQYMVHLITRAHRQYYFIAPSLRDGLMWLKSSDIVRFYFSNVKDRKEWMHPMKEKSKQCSYIRPSSGQCKRYTYSRSVRCWQHFK